MFKIGEFSKITQVSVRMLRYYDELNLLAPDVIDNGNGYRYYSASQIDELNRMILLRNLGFGAKDVKRLINDWSDERIKAELEFQLTLTKQNVSNEKKKISMIQSYIDDLSCDRPKSNIQIVMKELPSENVLSLRRKVDNYYCEADLWKQFGETLGKTGYIDLIDCNNKNNGVRSFSIYHDKDYREENVDIEVCMILDNNYLDKAGDDIEGLVYRQTANIDIAACFIVYGPYSNISCAYKEFAFWLESHKEYEMSGENRQICHVSCCDTSNPEKYVTELQIPLCFTDTE